MPKAHQYTANLGCRCSVLHGVTQIIDQEDDDVEPVCDHCAEGPGCDLEGAVTHKEYNSLAIHLSGSSSSSPVLRGGRNLLNPRVSAKCT